MQTLGRIIGLGYLAICLLVVAAKALLPLGALGYAPLALPLGPGGQPIELVVWYGTEKQEWMEEAARRFEADGSNLSGRPISVRLVGMGSGEIADRVSRQDWGSSPAPAVISPASGLWVEVLRSEWAGRNGGEVVEATPTPLVLTPLVAVAWEQRANVLWPQGVKNFWKDLHDALTDQGGWPAVAAKNGFKAESPEGQEAARWGFVKFGHTTPLSSNSGAQALILMAYAYHNKTDALTQADVTDAGFQRWLDEVESAVLDFGDSTGTFMNSMVQFGPSKYDLVMVYENLAIENIDAAQSRWGQSLRVYYPPATSFSDHPYAVLQEPLTSAEQRGAAEVFRRFLLARAQQELALQYGFRPADPSVSVANSAPNNPFNRFASYGVQVDVAQQVQTPPGATIAILLNLWRQKANQYTLNN